MSDNKRIAKNTLFLYFRMLFVMGVSIYSSRIVLNVLGASDYGLYNVVGGVVAMLSFLNGAASGATSRYLTYYLGKKDISSYQQSFSASFYIHIGVAILIAILAETVGLWFLYNKLNIAPERVETAAWVFHLSILSCFITFTQVPYNASIIAHERMGVYAYVGVAEAILKLTVLYLLSISSFDKLKSYAFLLFLVSLLIALFYRFYCKYTFKECRLSKVHDFSLFRDLLKYSGWDTLGSMTGIAQTQGINIVLNLFFGTVVNAARGVAYQVDAAVTNFIANFLMAMNPQIVKAYAAGDLNRMTQLIFFGGKYAFLMFSCLAVPIIIEAPYILQLWLVNPPEYSTAFLRLVLINHFLSVLIQIVNIGVHATGDVKRLNLYAGTISILKLPLAYILLLCGLGPTWVFVAIIPLTLFCLFADLYVLRKNVVFPTLHFMYYALLKNLLLILIPILLVLFINSNVSECFGRLTAVTVCYILFLGIILYLFGISNIEKKRLNTFISKLVKKFI